MTFKRPKIMGILNVTPDSFSDGGQFGSLDMTVRGALSLLEAGADILDIGGESTRPGAQEVSVREEINRTVPVIAALRDATKDFDNDPLISIDTRKPEVAEAAIHAGADIWNDVTGLTFDAGSVDMAAKLGCPLILMHIQGSPETMQDNPDYGADAVGDIMAWLAARIDVCEAAGIERDLITLDPGVGFGKRHEDNIAIFKELARFKTLGCPLLMGASRKSFIGRVDGSASGWLARNGALECLTRREYCTRP
ncbi:MAG: dihydropteroate synthase [Maricaulaceae bacterium]